MAKETIQLPEILTVKQLADALNQPVTAIIAKLMGFGVLATINEDIDFDTAAIVADDFGVSVERQSSPNAHSSTSHTEHAGGNLQTRPPVVTIMGHVDHGKTTLLDTIRKTNVAEKEAGGITQHISSYQIEVTPKDKSAKRTITFLDTPGHSAFEAMRKHGARITDLVILVVAADDGVKPQTVEAVNHAKSMNIPMVVAINKMDKPEADADRVKRELSELGLIPEEWGGKTTMVPISAKQGTGIDDLMEIALLSTDLRNLQANFEVPAVGVVIESHLQMGIGPVATVLIQNGSLKIGDHISIGSVSGRIRTLTDFRGKKITIGTPGTPVEISGLSEVPQFGEQLAVFDSEKESKESARQFVRSQTAKRAITSLGSSAHTATQKEGDRSILNIIVKADTDGSLEAITSNLQRMRNDDVEARVIAGGIGDISEGDIMRAVASKALVIGFNVRIPAAVKSLSDRENVHVSLYTVVYELFDAIRDVLADLMPMIDTDKEVATLTILARFRDTHKNAVIGARVEEGTISAKQSVRITRKGNIIAEGSLAALRQGKNTINAVQAGSECGLEISFSSKTEEPQEKDKIIAYVHTQEKKAFTL